jgi:hypothetical protein
MCTGGLARRATLAAGLFRVAPVLAVRRPGVADFLDADVFVAAIADSSAVDYGT